MILHVHLFKDKTKYPNFWQKLTPQTRLLCALMGVFAIAFTPHGHWKTWGFYGIIIICLVFLSRVSLTHLCSRVGLEFAFVGVVLLGTLFRREGEIIWSWGIFQVTNVGLIVLGSITLKVFLSLLLLNLLILTTSISDLFQALIALKTPPLLVAIMASMYRYLEVLIDEFSTMKRAAMSRNLMLKNAATRQVIGNIIGALFIRTYERGERVYQAMLARGYQGLPPRDNLPRMKKVDYGMIFFTLMIIFIGQMIYFYKG